MKPNPTALIIALIFVAAAAPAFAQQNSEELKQRAVRNSPAK